MILVSSRNNTKYTMNDTCKNLFAKVNPSNKKKNKQRISVIGWVLSPCF